MPSEDIKAKLERRARNDVRSFSRLKLDDIDVGLNMLRDLEKHPDGIEQVVGDKFYEPREIAAEIRNKNAHAVLWHPEIERYFFASEMHREAAKTLLGQPRDTAGMQTHLLPTARVEKEGQSLLVLPPNPRRTPSKLLSIAQNSPKNVLAFPEEYF